MYAAYFGLDENPFSITPDPRYLYLGRRHAEALAHLLYGIREGGGFIQLTGEVGTGKTTLTRSLLEELPEDVDVALILNPRLDISEFLAAICQELHIDVPAGAGNRERIDALNRHLLDRHAAGRRTVLIIDEAQNLSVDVLEQVRLLTNLETARTKLLQILLIGQPELRETLAQPELRQLAQRVTARYHLDPLDRDELDDYIQHRLGVAGARAPIFNRRALQRAWRHSGGIPRLANIICDRALLGAFTREEREVTARMVDTAASEVMGPKLKTTGRQKQHPAWHRSLLAGGILAAVLLGLSLSPLPGTLINAGQPPQATVQEAHVPGFDDWLLQHADSTTTDTALDTLFRTWGARYEPGNGPACEQAEQQGLRCLYERGTWRSLRQLDRPAVLSLEDESGNPFQVVITTAGQDSVQLAAGKARTIIDTGTLNRWWLGEYLALWQPPALLEIPLSRGSQGPGVRWLREQLEAALGEAETVTDAGIFDAGLEARVREFQARERLTIDGIAGERTIARLVTLTGADDAPALAMQEGS